MTEQTGSTVNPFQYIGKKGYYFSANSNTHFIRHRPYLTWAARWLSKDIMGVELKGNVYDYVANIPTRFVDPSGMFAEADACCECNELWRQVRGERDYEFDFYLITEPSKMYPNKKNRCRIDVSCEPIKSCKGQPGRTEPPTKANKNDIYDYIIKSCVSCRYKPNDLVFKHELVHARQYCHDPGLDLTICSECVKYEKKAHESSCNIAFPIDRYPPPRKAYNRCVECGIWFSCKDTVDCSDRIIPKGKPCDIVIDMGGSGPWTPND